MVWIALMLGQWWLWQWPGYAVANANKTRIAAENAYQNGRFAQARQLYEQVRRRTPNDAALLLNLGNSYFRLGRFAEANRLYRAVMAAQNPNLRAAAATQLGVLACQQRDSSRALDSFRLALLINPNNSAARYNYELIARQFTPHELPPAVRKAIIQISINQPISNQVEHSDKQDQRLRRFDRLNLTEEQALQLLNAMQSDDLPYALTRTMRAKTTQPPAQLKPW